MAQTVRLWDLDQVDEMARHLIRRGRELDLIEVRVPARMPVGSLVRNPRVSGCFRIVASRLQSHTNVIRVSAREWAALRGIADGPSG